MCYLDSSSRTLGRGLPQGVFARTPWQDRRCCRCTVETVITVNEAAELAEKMLAETLPRRWRHVQSVARRARWAAEELSLSDDLVAAAASGLYNRPRPVVLTVARRMVSPCSGTGAPAHQCHEETPRRPRPARYILHQHRDRAARKRRGRPSSPSPAGP